MLFDASTTYASGEPHGDAGYSDYHRVSVLGKYHLDQLTAPNIWIGLGGLALIAFLVHKYGGRKR